MRSTSSSRCRASTATTWSRRSPGSRGSPTTRSGCWASPTAASASSSPARLSPPSLAAIAPLSVIDQVQTTLYPGGILNTGFAYALGAGADARGEAGRPCRSQQRGPALGRPARSPRATRPAGTTRTCTPRPPTSSRRSATNDHYVPEVADPRLPDHVRRQDQRARSSWPASGPTSRRAATARRSPKHMTGTDKKWFTYTNGTHVDSLDPETYNRLYDFFKHLRGAAGADRSNRPSSRRPRPWPSRRSSGSTGLSGQCAPPAMTLPPDPIQAQPTYEPRQGGVRGTAADPRPVRQRRRQLEQSRLALPGIRALVLALPDPGHHGSLLVPGARRRPRRRARHRHAAPTRSPGTRTRGR